jgi:hypothetical protein
MEEKWFCCKKIMTLQDVGESAMPPPPLQIAPGKLFATEPFWRSAGMNEGPS